MRLVSWIAVFLILLVWHTGAQDVPSVALSSLGSSISLSLCRTWAAYNRVASKQLSALATAGGDSGVGRGAALQDTAPIGTSDAPLSIVEQVKAPSVITIPVAITGVAIGYNLPGSPALRFSPDLLAQIFMRRVTLWNDPLILAENPGLTYTGSIILVRRSDDSGTSYIFTDYLTRSAGSSWELSKSTRPIWPLASSSALEVIDNTGAFNALERTIGSIGYLSWNFAVAFKSARTAALQNANGIYYNINATSLNACTDAVTSVPSALGRWQDYSLTWTQADAWPLCSFTYFLVRQNRVAQAAAGVALKSYLSLTMGTTFQAAVSTLNLVALPGGVVTQNVAAINSMQVAASPLVSAYQTVDISGGIPANPPQGGSSGTTLLGGGSTFVAPWYDTVLPVFQNRTSNKLAVSYSAIGSGNGISLYTTNPPSSDFACSDAPLSAAQVSAVTAASRTILHLPQTMGAIAIAHNIPTNEISGSLNLTAALLAGIFQRQITSWGDSQLRAVNPNLRSTSPISVVARSDSSGTTFAFSDFLSAATNLWSLGRSNSIQWPVGTILAPGNSGVFSVLSTVPNSIGYIDFSLAKDRLAVAAIENRNGEYRSPSSGGCTRAANSYTQNSTLPNGEEMSAWRTVSINNQNGVGVYPVCTFVYFMVDLDLTKTGASGHAVKLLLTFLTGNQAQFLGTTRDYSPLPSGIITANQRTISLIQVDTAPFDNSILSPEPSGFQLTDEPLQTTAQATTPAPTKKTSASTSLQVATGALVILLFTFVFV